MIGSQKTRVNARSEQCLCFTLTNLSLTTDDQLTWKLRYVAEMLLGAIKLKKYANFRVVIPISRCTTTCTAASVSSTLVTIFAPFLLLFFVEVAR